MADETTTDAGTTQNTGNTLLTGGDASAVAAGEKPQTEAKPEGEKPATDQTSQEGGEAGKEPEGEKKGEGDKPAPKAPEKYEFKLPEGVSLDETTLAKFEPLARKLDLDNAAAQELVSLYTDVQRAQAEAWMTTVKGWQEEVKSDPVMGGKNLESTINAGKAFLKEYGDSEVADLLDQYGIGNHKAIIRLFAKAGRAMGEDKFINQRSTTSEPRTAEDILYGSK